VKPKLSFGAGTFCAEIANAKNKIETQRRRDAEKILFFIIGTPQKFVLV